MGIFDFFNKKSGAIAKDRLKLVLAHERSVNVPYIEDMKREIIAVIKKYTQSDKIAFKTDSNQNISLLEIEIKLD